MTHPLRLLAALLICVLSATLLAACGGDEEGGGDDDVATILEETFGPDKPIRSGDVRLALDLDLQGIEGLEGPVRVGLTGPFQSNGARTLPDFDFDATLSAGGQSFTAGAVSTGDSGFLELQGEAFELSEELFAQFRDGYEQAQEEGEEDDGEAGPTFGALGIDPRRWLSGAQDAGDEEIGGDPTDHVTATVDVPRFLDDVASLLDRAQDLGIEGAEEVPAGISEEQRRQIAESVRTTSIDVWSGSEDRTLRRVRVAVDLAVPEDARAQIGGLESGRIAFDLTFNELNDEQQIAAPENARPFEDLTGGLGGALGGGTTTPPSGGTAPPAGGSAQPPAAPQADAPQAYLDCLSAAGDDIAEVQGCAQFLR